MRIGDGPGVWADAVRPRQFLHERSGLKELAVAPIENIEEAIAVGVSQ